MSRRTDARQYLAPAAIVIIIFFALYLAPGTSTGAAGTRCRPTRFCEGGTAVMQQLVDGACTRTLEVPCETSCKRGLCKRAPCAIRGACENNASIRSTYIWNTALSQVCVPYWEQRCAGECVNGKCKPVRRGNCPAVRKCANACHAIRQHKRLTGCEQEYSFCPYGCNKKGLCVRPRSQRNKPPPEPLCKTSDDCPVKPFCDGDTLIETAFDCTQTGTACKYGCEGEACLPPPPPDTYVDLILTDFKDATATVRVCNKGSCPGDDCSAFSHYVALQDMAAFQHGGGLGLVWAGMQPFTRTLVRMPDYQQCIDTLFTLDRRAYKNGKTYQLQAGSGQIMGVNPIPYEPFGDNRLTIDVREPSPERKCLSDRQVSFALPNSWRYEENTTNDQTIITLTPAAFPSYFPISDITLMITTETDEPIETFPGIRAEQTFGLTVSPRELKPLHMGSQDVVPVSFDIGDENYTITTTALSLPSLQSVGLRGMIMWQTFPELLTAEEQDFRCIAESVRPSCTTGFIDVPSCESLF